DPRAHLHQPDGGAKAVAVRHDIHGLGTQIRKRFSSGNFSKSRASSRSVFCLRTRCLLISAASPIHTSKSNSASNRSNQREYPVASKPIRTRTPLCFSSR